MIPSCDCNDHTKADAFSQTGKEDGKKRKNCFLLPTDNPVLFLRIKLLYNDVNNTGAGLKLRQMFLMKQQQEDRFPGKLTGRKQ